MKNIQRENKQTITALKTKKGKKEIKRGTNKKKKKKSKETSAKRKPCSLVFLIFKVPTQHIL